MAAEDGFSMMFRNHYQRVVIKTKQKTDLHLSLQTGIRLPTANGEAFRAGILKIQIKGCRRPVPRRAAWTAQIGRLGQPRSHVFDNNTSRDCATTRTGDAADHQHTSALQPTVGHRP